MTFSFTHPPSDQTPLLLVQGPSGAFNLRLNVLLKSAHVSRCLENGNSLLLIKIRILAEVYGELSVVYRRMTRSEKETIDSLTIGSFILYLQYGGGFRMPMGKCTWCGS